MHTNKISLNIEDIIESLGLPDFELCPSPPATTPVSIEVGLSIPSGSVKHPALQLCS